MSMQGYRQLLSHSATGCLHVHLQLGTFPQCISSRSTVHHVFSSPATGSVASSELEEAPARKDRQSDVGDNHRALTNRLHVTELNRSTLVPFLTLAQQTSEGMFFNKIEKRPH